MITIDEKDYRIVIKKPVLEEEFDLLSSGYGTTIHDKDNTKFVILINDNEPLTLFHELLHTAIRVEPFMKQYYEDMLLFNSDMLDTELDRFKQNLPEDSVYKNYHDEYIIEEMIVETITKADEETCEWLIDESPLLQLISIEDIGSLIADDEMHVLEYNKR